MTQKPPQSTAPRMALVHEWFVNYAGSEKVMEQFIKLYPEADIHALVDFLPVEERGYLQGKAIKTSFLQRLPFARKHFRNYLPLFPLAIEQADVRGADIVLSSSHLVGKGVLTAPDQLHICYCHSPVRYGWDLYHQYLEESGLTGWGPKALVAKWTLHKLRQWDYLSAQRVDYFIANSQYIARRIKKVWGRDAVVIYPPVATSRFQLVEKKQDYWFTAARWVPYKKVDMIVRAFAQMPDQKLIVAGDGPLRKAVEAACTPNIQLLKHVPATDFVKYMAEAKAFVFAAEEDFGITIVEAMACGTPVLAYGKGGATETVLHGKTGAHFSEQTEESLIKAVQSWAQLELDSPAQIRQHALQFSEEAFQSKIRQQINAWWSAFEGK